jgi:hypothetical protein
MPFKMAAGLPQMETHTVTWLAMGMLVRVSLQSPLKYLLTDTWQPAVAQIDSTCTHIMVGHHPLVTLPPRPPAAPL